VYRQRLRVVLDANVVFPFTLRDTLLRAAAMGFYQVHLTEEILEEASRNLTKTGRMTDRKAAHLMAAIRGAFPDALVFDYEPLIEEMLNDAKDRHVVAAAVRAGACRIVTSNLKDFYRLPEGVEAQGPDAFLLELLEQNSEQMMALLHDQAGALKRPPVSLEQLLGGLGKVVPLFVHAVRERL